MTEGNVSQNVKISKKEVVIARGMGSTLPQLADKYKLSNQQMRMAMIDMNLIKSELPEDQPGELTAREQKLLDVCIAHEVTPATFNAMLEELGLEYKTGRRGTHGKKYIVIDDLILTPTEVVEEVKAEEPINTEA